MLDAIIINLTFTITVFIYLLHTYFFFYFTLHLHYFIFILSMNFYIFLFCIVWLPIFWLHVQCCMFRIGIWNSYWNWTKSDNKLIDCCFVCLRIFIFTAFVACCSYFSSFISFVFFFLCTLILRYSFHWFFSSSIVHSFII